MENKPTYEELQAQVEALREMANRASAHLTKGYAGQSFSAIDCNLALSALAEIDSFTPQQHLAEIRAEAVLDAVKFFAPAMDIETESLEWYAAKVRQGGAA